MSPSVNGSSLLDAGHDDSHSYTNGGVDFVKIGQICLAGLREANNGQKATEERCESIEQSIAELRSDIELKVSPLETSHQGIQTLMHENETLKQSLTLLSKRIDPAWKSHVDARLADYDLLAQKVQKMAEHMATMSQLLETRSGSIGEVDSARPASDVPNLQKPVTSLAPGAPAASASSGPSLASPARSVPHSPQTTRPVSGSTSTSKHASQSKHRQDSIEQVARKKSQYTEALDMCSQILAGLGATGGHDTSLDKALAEDVANLSMIDFSAPLADKKAFDHKRDWVQAWQAALEQVQQGLSETAASVERKAAAVRARDEELRRKERTLHDAGTRLKEVLNGMQEDCDAIIAVKAMQEDHEEELYKRLKRIEEQEGMIRQDSYIMSIKGKRAYEKDAAEFRRVEELRSLRRELESRIQQAIAFEQQQLNSGKAGLPTSALPIVDDLPVL